MPENRIPRAVLSEHLQERLRGRKIIAAVFWTFRFDPGFFEKEVLPVLFDIPASHAESIRLLQLEDILGKLPHRIAVYYDGHGLVEGGSGSSRLDVQRVPVWPVKGSGYKAIFHPKNVFLLVEEIDEENPAAPPARSLLVGCMSANLTQAGWWANVEVAHFEELQAGEPSRLKEPLLKNLNRLLRSVHRRPESNPDAEHTALATIRDFVGKLEPRSLKSYNKVLYPHYWGGEKPLIDFLQDTAGDALYDRNLEVISPYFDDADESEPLEALIEQFKPRQVRVYLPRDEQGNAQVSTGLYTSIAEGKKRAWGRLPGEMERLGKAQEAAQRTVHAKVYRFFGGPDSREILFIGSPNLTKPGHQGRGGNWESGLLVEVKSSGKPGFWLESEDREPGRCAPRSETEDESATAGGTRLLLRYDWRTEVAAAFWVGDDSSPSIRISWAGGPLFDVGPLLPAQWIDLDKHASMALAKVLKSTSFVQVVEGDAEPVVLLVQEEGMSKKPPLIEQLQLSAADILEYWSMLSDEQRAVFLEGRALALGLIGDNEDLVARVVIQEEQDSVFGRYARFFHAFSCVDKAVRMALAAKNYTEVDYRLFGRKYDSLGSLLDRVIGKSGDGDKVAASGDAVDKPTKQPSLDLIDRYIIYLCAQQLLEIAKESEYEDYFSNRRQDLKALENQLGAISGMREAILEKGGPSMSAFLPWFERRFIRRAQPMKGEQP